MEAKLLSPSEVLKIVEVEDRLRNIKWYPAKNSSEVREELKFYMERHRIPFLKETALYAIHRDDIRRFDCTLTILDGIYRHVGIYINWPQITNGK